MSEQERPAEAQPATSDGLEDAPADRELNQSELDKVSGGVCDLSMTPVRNLRG